LHSVANANGQPELHANCHSNGYRHSDSNSYGYRDGHSHGDCDRDGNANCDRTATRYTVATAPPVTDASWLRGIGKLIVHCAAGIDRSRLRVFGRIPSRNPPHSEWRAATTQTSP